MKIVKLDVTPVSVPYKHREVSSQVQRDGVTSIIVQVETDEGLVGWGEACSGSDTRTVLAAVEAMRPFVIGADPFDREALRDRLYWYGLWQFQAGSANFAWAGLDMAMWDVCGKALELPIYQLLGGARRTSASYFYYLSRSTPEALATEIGLGLEQGYDVFYLKVGLDDAADEALVRHARACLGQGPLLRLDVNGAWSPKQARTMLRRLSAYDIDFVEQPVRESPSCVLGELRRDSPIAICANEGLWSAPQAYERIRDRQADVYCFSTYWVGGLATFQHLANVAALEGALVCKHTHGELGIAAAAGHHALLTLTNIVRGNQQTTAMMEFDITEALPIATGPEWGIPAGPGLGVEVVEDALQRAAKLYSDSGQFLPYQESAKSAFLP